MMAPMKSTIFCPQYLHTEVLASTMLLTLLSPNQFGRLSLANPSAPKMESKPNPGVKKNLKINPIAIPLIRYGKNIIPLKMLPPFTLKLKTVARYRASTV